MGKKVADWSKNLTSFHYLTNNRIITTTQLVALLDKMKYLFLFLLLSVAFADYVSDPLVKWYNIPAWVENAGANNGHVWATNGIWQLFSCRLPCKGNWRYKGWFAANVATNRLEVWVIAADGRIFRSRYPARQTTFWAAWDGWSIVNGILKQVSLGDSLIAGVNRDNYAYYSEFLFRNGQSQPNWIEMPGRFLHISVSSDNQIYAVSTGRDVLYWNMKDKKWEATSNPQKIAFEQVSIGRRYLYATDVGSNIYRCVRPCKIGGWLLTAGKVRKIIAENMLLKGQIFGITDNNNLYTGIDVPL